VKVERLYLDYNATSPLSSSVTDWLKSGDFYFANPSSQHSDGKSSRKVINEARSFLFRTFGLSEKESHLFFHSGATEAFHTFAYSFSETARLSGKDLLICFSKIDHPAVTSLGEKFFGSHVKFFELERDQSLNYQHQKNFDAIKDKKENNPDLFILYHHLWVHNETGQVSNPEELRSLKEIPDLFIHVDSVQAPGKIEKWNHLSTADIWTFSPHKFGALKGCGFTFFKRHIPYHAFFLGGAQQGGLRSGTENVMAIHSTYLALKDLLSVTVETTQRQRRELLEFLKNELGDSGEVLDGGLSASNTIYFYFNHLTSDIALALFDLNGIELSTGSACSSGAAKESAVLLQMGKKGVARNGLRLSLPFVLSQDKLQVIKERMGPVIKKILFP
jgi:cysteine desulfurase